MIITNFKYKNKKICLIRGFSTTKIFLIPSNNDNNNNNNENNENNEIIHYPDVQFNPNDGDAPAEENAVEYKN
jgi:hypothetical protein